MNRKHLSWTLLILANVLAFGVLGFYQTSGAAPQTSPPPFQNAVEQRQEMIRELKEITALLKEQNALLRDGAKKTPIHDSRQK